jgi:N-acetylmuramoyl-L-alanine amidase
MNRARQFVAIILLVVAVFASACGGAKTGENVAAAVQDLVEQSTSATGAGQVDRVNAATATVTAQNLRVRSEPSSAAKVLGTIKQDQTYAVVGLSSDGEWVQLQIPALSEGKGWVSANFVTVQGAITDAAVTKVTPAAAKPAAGSGATTTAAAAGAATVKTEGTRLRVREQPSTDAKIVGYVYNGETYPVVEQSSDGTWVKIGGRNGTDNLNGGWVAAEFLVID